MTCICMCICEIIKFVLIRDDLYMYLARGIYLLREYG